MARRTILLATLLALGAGPTAPAQAPPGRAGKWYVVLANDQLCPPPTGYAEYVEANRAKKRSGLRKEGLKTLKERARKAGAKLLRALGNPKGARQLWVVNAVVAQLTPEQATQARQLKTVLGVFPAGPVPQGTGRGKVGDVVNPPRKRPRFSMQGKQVPWNLKGLKVPEAWGYEKVDGTGGTVTGVAPRARLMLLRAWGGFYVAARAFEYALDKGADVISMSFSIPNLGQTRGLWRLMCEHASACGLASVSGAGNFQQQQPIPVQIRIPEGIPCVICAGGVNRDLSLPRFVSLGPVEWASVKLYGDHPMPKGIVKPDVCAYPGPRIALVASGDTGYLPPNNGKRGNSLSAPHVAGACALMLDANPELMPWRLKAILEETAADVAPKGKDPKTGAGLMNVVAAVRKAKKG